MLHINTGIHLTVCKRICYGEKSSVLNNKTIIVRYQDLKQFTSEQKKFLSTNCSFTNHIFDMYV